MKVAVQRPALRWYGGKWILAPWIISHFPKHRVYVEPFGGAASVLMRKERSCAEIYNDLDHDVVNLFRVLRSDAAPDLIEAIRLTPFARREFKSAYEECEDPVEKARRLIVRSFMGFGADGATAKATGFRSNSNRSGTTPAHDWANYADAMGAMVDRLKGCVIESRPATEVMTAHDSAETLHYVDPPYLFSTRSPGHGYRHEMTDEQHKDLLACLLSLKGRVVLSGYPNEMYDDALSGWERVERRALADGARERTEVLWMNFDASRSLPLFSQEPEQ